jgi:acetoin utilization deacetylase AcuC-like enzyme
MTTAFYTDERTFWHHGGNYALTLPVGGPIGALVQPGGGLPESPETKRRLKNLIEVTGLIHHLSPRSADPATREDLLRVHPATYLDRFKALSDADGGELGPRAPFGRGGYELAALSAGLAKRGLIDILTGQARNGYALSRPPGHHCLPDHPNGFCLLANIAIAIRAAQAQTPAKRFAVIDWDVHHGNGTEAIFLDDPDILTISLHQDRNYPTDTGQAEIRGQGTARGTNLNIPLPPGTGHKGYLQAFTRLVIPALHAHKPDAILIACGFDAAALDPLGRMLATADTFRQMTRLTMQAADALCDGRLLAVHEGGYSEVYVPFCGHAVIEELAQSPESVTAPDPLAATLGARQPDPRFDAFLSQWIDDLETLFSTP